CGFATLAASGSESLLCVSAPSLEPKAWGGGLSLTPLPSGAVSTEFFVSDGPAGIGAQRVGSQSHSVVRSYQRSPQSRAMTAPLCGSHTIASPCGAVSIGRHADGGSAGRSWFSRR